MRLVKNSLSIVMYHYIKEAKSNEYKNFKFLEYSKFKKQINFFKKILTFYPLRIFKKF